MEKTPVSLLQELTTKLSLHLPKYEIYDMGKVGYPWFKCVVVVDHHRADGEAPNKKEAKQNSARKLLEQLGYKTIVNLSEKATTVALTDNFIGKLNEYCSQNGLSYPVYNETYALHEGFTLKCSLGNYHSLGKGSSKKIAKQHAAKEMLEIVEKETDNQVIINVPHIAHICINSDVDKVISKFQELSTSEVKNLMRDERTLEENIKDLEAYNVNYKLEIITQDRNYIVFLKSNKNLVLMGAARTLDEAKNEAFRQAVFILEAMNRATKA